RILTQPPRELVTVHGRHQNVGDDQVRPLRSRQCERLGAVAGFKAFMPPISQQRHQQVPIRRAVIDNQYCGHQVSRLVAGSHDRQRAQISASASRFFCVYFRKVGTSGGFLSGITMSSSPHDCGVRNNTASLDVSSATITRAATVVSITRPSPLLLEPEEVLDPKAVR